VKNNIGYITRKIIELENTKNLFEWEISNIFIWEIIRYQIYSAIVFNNGNEKKVNNRNTMDYFISKFFNNFSKYINAIVFNPFLDFKESDILIFESSRKLLYNNQYIDPYTNFIREDLENRGLKVTRYQSSYAYDRLSKRNFKIKHLDLVFFISSLFKNLSQQKFSNSEIDKINDLESWLYNEFSISFDLRSIINTELSQFRINSFLYRLLLRIKKPKEIFLVNFCDKSSLIDCAKKNNINVVDIQHGIISSEDIIYHYPNVKKGSLRYFPNKFYTWSKIWTKTCKIPLEMKDIIIYSNKFLLKQNIKFKNLKKIDNQIVILSQPGLTNQIAECILKNISMFSMLNIVYKLHPNEYLQKDKYKSLLEIEKKENVHFASKNIDLHELLAKSVLVIGVYSTALIEAASFDCKVVLLDLPGVEMMRPFLNNTNIIMFKTKVT